MPLSASASAERARLEFSVVWACIDAVESIAKPMMAANASTLMTSTSASPARLFLAHCFFITSSSRAALRRWWRLRYTHCRRPVFQLLLLSRLVSDLKFQGLCLAGAADGQRLERHRINVAADHLGGDAGHFLEFFNVA